MTDQRTDQRNTDNLIIAKLDDIKQETHEVNQKIDDLEQHLTKKAVISGAVAGSVTGATSSLLVELAIRLIKLQ